MLENSSNKSLILILFFFTFVGSFLTGAIILILTLISSEFESSIWFLRITIILQDLFVLFLPAYSVFKFSTNRPYYMLGMKLTRNMSYILSFSILMYLVAIPATIILAKWNEGIVFPESLAKLEAIFNSMEESAKEVTDKFLVGNSIIDLLINIAIIAGAAALVEEVFFRGALQQLLYKWFSNGHVAVWVTAIIFSAIHLQFYGFFPRLFLGAVLGYLFYFSRNLWVPILYHFVNNAMVVILNFYWGESNFMTKMEDAPLTWYSGVMLVVSLGLTYLLFAQFSKQLKRR